jgi:uncharacterized protein YegL
MLDNSGSMSNIESNDLSRWENLKNAVAHFIDKLMTDPLLQKNSRVSIISYNYEAFIECENQIPAKDILIPTQIPGYSTIFDPPLI